MAGDSTVRIGKSEAEEIVMRLEMMNRHGLIAGATGTGKTVTLRVIAEQLSASGVPVFMADVKGDLASICQPGVVQGGIQKRVELLGLTDFAPQGFPVMFWDVFGEQGHPVRTTVSEMGPLLLSRLLNLNETQAGVLSLAFRIADDQGLLLLDFKDLRAMIAFVGENAREFRNEYGNVSAASVGAIQRKLLELEEQGGEHIFGEPALNLDDFLQTDNEGRGVVNILDAQRLLMAPRAYAAFLLYLLSELFETLPEVGDADKPRLVFFFDEAHLLFTDAPKALVEKIELVVRLIRSKGVGVFFVTQNPLDLPDSVLAQLGHRVLHALRAFTPREQRVVRAVAETFRQNPAFDPATVIPELKVGEALVSMLDEHGAPQMAQRALIAPPMSLLGTLDPQERGRIIRQSVLYGYYEKVEDRESAYEMLNKRQEAREQKREEQLALEKEEREARQNRPRPSNRQSYVEAFAKSTLRSIGYSIGRKIARGILGSLMGK
ncbi:helicase HerA-like domain-containing protein [Oceanidesulfovibrio marinus]|uniref:ATP-binding protein n=1 Tax=Oceanidesulfovibrio marinus TaxID=370038 RepID=A0A6P1Z9R0_9BACT|nr:helicase HerA-like domain-containing protein [Oceanidesulfovibrio marinus]TVM30182.1 ATP-binding protein [Oceanidesulfovibrio marinus]